MERYFKVSESELKDLLSGYNHWLALMSGGVDNWSWRGGSEASFLNEAMKNLGLNPEENEDFWFEDLAESYLKDYQEVE